MGQISNKGYERNRTKHSGDFGAPLSNYDGGIIRVEEGIQATIVGIQPTTMSIIYIYIYIGACMLPCNKPATTCGKGVDNFLDRRTTTNWGD
jgi:hypothetical protein